MAKFNSNGPGSVSLAQTVESPLGGNDQIMVFVTFTLGIDDFPPPTPHHQGDVSPILGTNPFEFYYVQLQNELLARAIVSEANFSSQPRSRATMP